MQRLPRVEKMTIQVKSPVILIADARRLQEMIDPKTIDLIVTSPPYWQRRDYKHPLQIGREKTPEEYVKTLVAVVNGWKPLLRSHASVIVNLADVFRDGTLLGIPAMFEVALRADGWLLANRAIWAKAGGIPEPKSNRLARRYEFLFQFALQRQFFFDLHALEQHLGRTSNPGDVWQLEQTLNPTDHMAPFPPELARRAILVACPERLCPQCGRPHTRQLEWTMDLDTSRPQAQRALELFRSSSLTEEHIAAIRAVGISDAGKARKFQNGADKNAARTMQLAREAKDVLGGYFREFTFAPKRQVGWSTCSCEAEPCAGTVLDPFMGSGTTVCVASQLGRNAIGADLIPPPDFMPRKGKEG